MQIVTEGFGSVARTGDRAELNATFSAVAPTRTEAVHALGQRLGVLDEPLVSATILSRQLTVYDEWRGKRVVGCRAGVTVVLRIVDLSTIERIVDLLVAAEPQGLVGPRWLLAEDADAQRAAQHLALDDARRRAEGYAEATGEPLGRLVLLVESPDHHLRQNAVALSTSGAPDTADLHLDPELVTVTARCTTTWDPAGP